MSQILLFTVSPDPKHISTFEVYVLARYVCNKSELLMMWGHSVLEASSSFK